MQTAVVKSSGAANPHVPVLKLWVVSLSPTFAGRDLTLCRLKSHMAEELLSCERPGNPNSIAENGPTSHHARLARETCSTEPSSRGILLLGPLFHCSGGELANRLGF